jgi:hypothetical protein
MNRQNVIKKFEGIGSRITFRKGTKYERNAITINVARDKKDEHFVLTIHPKLTDEDIEITVLDVDTNLKQMLLLIRNPELTDEATRRVGSRFSSGILEVNRKKMVVNRLLVGHDEMHWFVAGVTSSTTIKQAFSVLRPETVTRVMHQKGVKDKLWKKRKNKGFIRQGEWFFVPVDFTPDKFTIIHKNEPINRRGGKAHMVAEIVRTGGETVYADRNGAVLTVEGYQMLDASKKIGYQQRVRGARVLARGKVRHPDHHVIELKGWHEVHLSSEHTMASGINAFID